ncbi:MAG: hypothetical protein DMG97_21155 [Acidobacteria bacterium]|nr:MAG: hypothetical protein DMG97_21155 [Acidobacteriota bacterium]PYV73926.1 MAG: hypothetical protein DMG96_21695 [Acidobacteriota bacterium]
MVLLLISSNFIVFFLLPVSACFFFHLSGSEKKQADTGEGTKRSAKEGGRARGAARCVPNALRHLVFVWRNTGA